MSEAIDLATAEVELDLSWMDRQGEWGTKVSPSKQGLTLADIQVGSYGDPPEFSDNMTGRPRGAGARPDSYRIGGYSVRSKSEIWLDNASFLYEEALQRQWSSATDVPWETIEPLPDDIEEAQCELGGATVSCSLDQLPGPSAHPVGIGERGAHSFAGPHTERGRDGTGERQIGGRERVPEQVAAPVPQALLDRLELGKDASLRAVDALGVDVQALPQHAAHQGGDRAKHEPL